MNPGKYQSTRFDEDLRVSPGIPLGDRYASSHAARPQRVTDVAITRFEHVYEVDPRPDASTCRSRTFPNWDTQRIVAAPLRPPRLDAPPLRRRGPLAGEPSERPGAAAPGRHRVQEAGAP